MPLSEAWASYQYPAYDIDVVGTIREEMQEIWHVWSRTGAKHHAVYFLEQPLAISPAQAASHDWLIPEILRREAETLVDEPAE